MSGREKENLIADWLEEHEEEVVRTADYIFRHPETAYKEELSSTYLASFLQENGFRVEKKTAGIDTAFTAAWGEGRPVIGFLAEYDALPELGHACGHNLLGTGAAAAACALKEDMERSGIPGTLRVYGCPAEEIMSGKIVMNRAGVFDDLDIAVTWHPFDRNRVSNDIWQAQDIKNYTFHGVGKERPGRGGAHECGSQLSAGACTRGRADALCLHRQRAARQRGAGSSKDKLLYPFQSA